MRLLARQDMTKIRRIINTLISASQGSDSKSRLMRKASLSYNQNGDIIIDELIDKGLLNYKQLRGDRNWVSVSNEGLQVLKAWREFSNLLE